MKKIPFSPPDITQEEINEVIDTLNSGWITTGPKTKEFELKIAEYCETPKAVCLNSATAGLELILRILGIGPGDEVITTAYTYTATASVIHHVGAKIVLLDVKKDTYQIDYDAIADKITHNTKAIIAVDIAGVIADYDKINSIILEKKKIFNPETDFQKKLGKIAVIADAAHSFGAIRNGKRSGSIADFTSFSFHAVKNLTTAEGGAVTWRDGLGISNDELYKQFMLYSLHGQSKDALAKSSLGGWEYDILIPGYKCNMTDIMAAIGLVQLKRYDQILKRREEIISRFEEYLENINVKVLKHTTENSKSSGHLFIVKFEEKNEVYRDKFIEFLAEKGIASNVHYKPLPMLTAYKNLGFDIKDFPNAYNMYKSSLSLPLNTLMSDEDISYVIESFSEILNVLEAGVPIGELKESLV